VATATQRSILAKMVDNDSQVFVELLPLATMMLQKELKSHRAITSLQVAFGSNNFGRRQVFLQQQ